MNADKPLKDRRGMR